MLTVARLFPLEGAGVISSSLLYPTLNSGSRGIPFCRCRRRRRCCCSTCALQGCKMYSVHRTSFGYGLTRLISMGLHLTFVLLSCPSCHDCGLAGLQKPVSVKSTFVILVAAEAGTVALPPLTPQLGSSGGALSQIIEMRTFHLCSRAPPLPLTTKTRTWDRGPGTWDLGPWNWDLGSGTWGLRPGARDLGIGEWGLRPWPRASELGPGLARCRKGSN